MPTLAPPLTADPTTEPARSGTDSVNRPRPHRKRILYGVQGEGRGHATRSLQVIQGLRAEGHEVAVWAGGDALPLLRDAGVAVREIPLLRYRYDAQGRLSVPRTLTDNTATALGLWLCSGKEFQAMQVDFRAWDPEVVISDFEPFTSRLARLHRRPLLAINHQHFLTESVLPRQDGWRKAVLLALYSFGTAVLGGRPDRIITSSFHHFPKKRNSRALFVGPFLADSVKRLRPHRGEGMVGYLKQPRYLDALLPTLRRHPEIPVRLYSDWSRHPRLPALPAHVELRRPNRGEFLQSLAEARGLITTAGNQVIGEAIYLGKPVLAFPEPGVIEQELNAAALARSGFGLSCDLETGFTDAWEAFLTDEKAFHERLAGFAASHPGFDGLSPTLRALNRWLRRDSRLRRAFRWRWRPLSRPRLRPRLRPLQGWAPA